MYNTDKNTNLLDELKAIKKDFREKNLKPFYFLYGDEDYFIDEISDNIIKVFNDETGLNFKEYKDDNFNIDEVIKYIISFPIVNEKKIILIKDVPFFKNVAKTDSKSVEKFLEAIKEGSEYNVLVIIIHNSNDKDAKYQKRFGKENKIASFFKENGVLIDLHRLDEATLNKYIVSRFSKSKKEIDKVESAYIIRNSGTNLKNLYNECDKIIAYMGDKVKVERADIDVVITKNIDDNIFNLINLINNNKMEEAIVLYGDLISAGEKPRDIFTVLSINYKNLLIAKDYMDKSKSQNEIAKLMGIETWQANRLVTANKYTTKESLASKLHRITDLSMKRFTSEVSEDMLFELLYY